MEVEKRKKAQRLAYSHLFKVLGVLIASPMYEVLGNPYEIGKTVRVRTDIYRMPILCFSSVAEELVTVGSVVVNVKTKRIIACSTKEEVCCVLTNIDAYMRVRRIHFQNGYDEF